LLSLTEITARKKLEGELRASVESLATSNADLEQFAYIASHDLQEPLRMISSYMTLLKQRYQGKLDSDADDFISYAVDGATRLQQMINDLLIFSRVQTRGKELVPAQAETAYMNAVENLAYSISEEKAEVTHDPLPSVLADATQLTMLFQNLLSNAIKFHGQEAPRIHVSVEPGDEHYKFCVQDNGIGIDPQFFDKIFLIFRRLHTREEYPGTGIGLAVCKRIVSRHGGQIWVESQDGQGTRFYFTLLRGDRKE
jgi:light-regulated signal transduction histidine kinase (bacteriophytochrome)